MTQNNDIENPIDFKPQADAADERSPFAEYDRLRLLHPKVKTTIEDTLNALDFADANSIAIIVGPSGVGKSFVTSVLPERLGGQGCVVKVEAMAESGRSFSWSHFYREVLMAVGDPLVEGKRAPDAPAYGQIPNNLSVNALRVAMENALQLRKIRAVIVDEAEHILTAGNAKTLLANLDVLKSIANRTRVPHILVGPYVLYECLSCSAQIARRTHLIHFPRYDRANQQDVTMFGNIVATFARSLPGSDPVGDLVPATPFIMERSLGCVGTARDLIRCSSNRARLHGHGRIRREDLNAVALAGANSDRMLLDIMEGEARLRGESRRRAEPSRMAQASFNFGGAEEHPQGRQLKPGEPRRKRWPVGLQS